jgi:hypothetical protein
MKKEWFSILWILAVIFGIVALISVWNQNKLGFKRTRMLEEKDYLCKKISQWMPQYGQTMEPAACENLLARISMGQWSDYRDCLDEKNPLPCVSGTLCRDLGDEGCLLKARIQVGDPDTVAAGIKELTGLCETRHRVDACALLQVLSTERPELGLAAPKVWHSRVCQLSGRNCTTAQDLALSECLANPLGACLDRLESDPDPMGLFLACEAGSGRLCRRWAEVMFPHLSRAGDLYWSEARLGQLCLQDDPVSCARLGVTRAFTPLLTHACARGDSGACNRLLTTETVPVRRRFLEHRIAHGG